MLPLALPATVGWISLGKGLVLSTHRESQPIVLRVLGVQMHRVSPKGLVVVDPSFGRPIQVLEFLAERWKQMEQRSEEREPLLGFLGLYQTANQDGFLGALLITDRHGVPKEFRCTHPVKPTSVQKPLYGDALRPYVGVELCGNRLIESTELKPTLIFVSEDFLVRTRVKSQCPVVFVRRAGETLEITPQSDEEVAPNKVRLECPGGRFQPITVSPHPEYADDVYSAMEEVDRVFPYLDPIEPFDRIRQAIDVLAKQDARFR